MATQAQKNRAVRLYSGWRKQGVEQLVTARAAFMLTNGIVGREGIGSDKEFLNLSTVALEAAVKAPKPEKRSVPRFKEDAK